MEAPPAHARRPVGARRAPPRLALLASLLASLLILAGPVVPIRAEEEAKEAEERAWIDAAHDARSAVVRVQWRSRRRPAESVERHAVVIDRDGWLLMAGPQPAEGGTLAATFVDGRSMRALLWARDAASGLCLLRVPLTALRTLKLRPPEPDGRETVGITPPRWRPGFRLAMVTAEGALARGSVRASHRARTLLATGGGPGAEVTCLDEAALSVLPTDLGAPWIDRKGRLIGLLVGADLGVAMREGEETTRGLHPRPEVTAAYAVPSQVIRIVWPLLRDHREVRRAALGVSTFPLSEAIARHVCPDCGGRIVQLVRPGGAAHRAGLLPRDIIRRVDGLDLARGATLGDALLPYRPGDRIRLGILRRGKKAEAEAMLTDAP